MNIYVAAPWTRRAEAARVAQDLIAQGHHITHDWWRHEVGDEDHPRLARCAQWDYYGVIHCDAFVLLNYERSEGKAVETGVALATNRRCIGVGPRFTNIFHHLDHRWTWVETVADLLDLTARNTQIGDL